MSERTWVPVGGNLDSIVASCPDPLRSLAEAEIPAILIRQAYDPVQCDGLTRRFIDQGLMRDPNNAEAAGRDTRTRIDIGTSLGNKGSDQDVFFAHAKETRDLFETLFDGFNNPVTMMYEALQTLGGEKKIVTAYEPDGRQYGPAIFRVHYDGHSYKPHIDHVVLREKRFTYAVSRYQHQFAGVLCVQNALHEGRSTQAILHRCLWTQDVQQHIENDTFRAYAGKEHISNYTVQLEQGDMYFFNTRLIHEVPPVEGSEPRIVLATFIGYDPDEPEVFLWS
ncbi:MAG: hypothetical protein VYA69_12535 [Gemmatimonadota bacterium]|nr:hypothetical protein [Gemmatimonadota bacterium]